MKSSYRLPFVILLFPILILWACSTNDHNYIVYVGTYTGHGSDGIYAYRFDHVKGNLTSIGLVAKTENPSFIAIDSAGRFLYAVNEVDSFQHVSSGAISVYSIDKQSGQLKLLQQIPSLGAGPAHLSLDKSEKYLLVVNYNGGNVAVFPRKEDGTLGANTAFVQDTGSSVNVERQQSPHAHFIGVTPDNRFALVADLGIDKILFYHFNPDSGSLRLSDPGFVSMHPGDGPRHISFSPSGKFFFVVNELTSTVTTFSFENGKARQQETVSILPKNFSGVNTAAEILTDSDGKHLYVSNRGDDSIGIFTIEPDGKLIPVEWAPAGGNAPRHFEIDPTGKWLFAANQNSNNIKLFQVDKDSGLLTQTAQSFELISPVCIRFVSTKQN